MRQLTSKLLVFLGVLFFFLTGVLCWHRNNPNRLAFDSIEEVTEVIQHKDGQLIPTKIIIEDLNINLPIIKAEAANQKWDTTSNGVSYLSTTPVPGETGNSILYGHNWKSILGNLVFAKTGQKINIILSNGETKTFEIVFIQEVTAKDTSILKNTTDKRITLYTCSGLFSSKRFVVTAVETT